MPNVSSIMALDERGVGLRATWRLNYGFINLSIWRDNTCIETFHLTPTDAATFVSFLVSGLAEVASVAPAAPVLRAAHAPTSGDMRLGKAVAYEIRSRAASLLRNGANKIAPR